MCDQPIRVLYVEDDLVDRMAFLRFVRQQPLAYDCTVAESAREAREHLAANRFDIVICDYSLGDETCLELLREHQVMPFIVVTGTGSEKTAVEAMKHGARDYLIKDPDGYYLTVLPSTVKNVLERCAAAAELERYREHLEELVQQRTADLVAEFKERLRAEAALRKSEERLRVALSAASMGTWWWDASADRDTRDAGLNRMLGLDPVESTQPRADLFDRLHPDDRGDAERALESAIRNRSVYFAEYRIVRSDGTIRWLRDQGRPYYDSSGALQYVTGAAVDITDRKQAEADQARLESRLQQIDKLNALGELALGVSHEFNNCLTAISTSVAVLQKQLESTEGAREPLQVVRQAVNQGMSISRSLQTFGRDVPSEKDLLNLGDVLEEARPVLEHTLPKTTRLEMTFKKEERLEIRADRTQLHQILLNLALNARDAMPDGGTLRIAAELCSAPEVNEPASHSRSSRSFVRLSVTDTGTGMPADVQAHIFDPFFTTKPRGQGTGLGLSIVHGIVNDHGGKIDVQSEVGKGTTFTITLPYRTEGAERPRETSRAPAAPGKGESILVAMKDPFLRGLVASFLGSAGYRALQAEDGAAVMERLRALPADLRLVILDAGLGPQGGYACLRDLRAQSARIPVVFVTAAAPPGPLDARTVLLAGVYDMPKLAAIVQESIAPGRCAEALA